MSSSFSNVRYRMVSAKDDDIGVASNELTSEDPTQSEVGKIKWKKLFRREEFRRDRCLVLTFHRYPGSLLFNLGAFILPALYGTLSKLWVANIDSSKVVTTDSYTYIGVIVEVLNEGLPRAAWVIIGDKSTRNVQSRLNLTYTLIAFQVFFGAIMTVVFIGSAERLASAFVPEAVRQASLNYVRISSVQALSSSMSVAVASSTRALDHPDVPLLISTVQFAVNIILDLLIISKFHVGSFTPTINTQALIRMTCDLSSAFCGFIYFIYIAIKMQRSIDGREGKPGVNFASLWTLIKPGRWTFFESALRNAIYLWLIHGIVSMGLNYATAWGVFNNIRWGIVMVPVNALEASTSAFVGHAWGAWRAQVGPHEKKPKATLSDLYTISRPAFVSCAIALAVEIPFCIFLSLWGIRKFSFYLSESEPVALITEKMWRTIDWCYIFYAIQTQMAAILLSTTPNLYFIQSLGSNLLWMLPWAIAVTKIHMTAENAWTYHSIIFGGASLGMVVDEREVNFDVFGERGGEWVIGVHANRYLGV
ncbi:hypothetical protein CJF30_00001723 [Rutstroemia sp. NJR-2017a BBW]|nr:hypothetical protein CJF30_00001723 [Rutstroemia sp. NJR-2017a BBW]